VKHPIFLFRRVWEPLLLDETRFATSASAQAEADSKSLGLHLERTLKVRSFDLKVVRVGRHPVWGPCVFKWVSPLVDLGRARTHTETLKLTAGHSWDIFPEVFYLGPHFSVESFVEGPSLDQFEEEEWSKTDLVAFSEQVKWFSQSHPSRSSLSKFECEIILRMYLRKLFRFLRYFSLPHRIAGRNRVFRRRREFRRLVQQALAALERLELPRGHALNDLSVYNIIREAGTGHLRVIDVEHTRDGHFFFDCVWLLLAMTRRSCPYSVLEKFYTHTCSDSFTGIAGGGSAARRVLHLFLEMDVSLRGRGERYSAQLLNLVANDVYTGR
jgi:hypothetical protein